MDLKNGNIILFCDNFIWDVIEPDFVFFSNEKRYNSANINSISREKVLVTSNIENEEISRVNYFSLINDITEIKDNSALMLIKLFIELGVKKVFLAGLDGYVYEANKNYYNERMVFVTNNDMMVKMNMSVMEMLEKYNKEIDIEFITDSLYQA